ncbi:hypothetical protein [Vibrio vulnificus]|uniref:hypothetical protein n=1 Tax=Vibrio vulnificus TaxID=672 RepID=UPI001033301B|nr:hypothetical protein [Vibrio vulnificus]
MRTATCRCLSMLMISLALMGCDSSQDGKMTAHDVYSGFVNEGFLPPPINAKLQTILEDSSNFGMTEYQELDLAIQKYCDGTDYSWRDYFSLLPMKAISIVVPGWNSLGVFSSPELMVVRQIDAANTCEFRPLTKYIEE